jgi:hypothetical protein
LRIGATDRSDTPAKAAGTRAAEYVRAMFLSKRDLVQAFTLALKIETDFMLAYAISNNDSRIFDMRETQKRSVFRLAIILRTTRDPDESGIATRDDW